MPRWFKQRQDESIDEYWNRVVAAAATVTGRPLYRPGDDAPLGVLSEKQVGSDLLPRWAAQRAPAEWTAPEDLTAWAIQRGWTN
eukprot:852529-Pyramimonas_sp.AAC.1